MQEQTRDLHYEERKWLYQAIWKIIVVDGRVAEEEFNDLREAMKWVRKDEMETLEEEAKNHYTTSLLPAPPRMNFGKSFMMLMEIIRVAAIDTKLLLGEITYIEQFARQLGFDDDKAIEALIQWAEKLTSVYEEKARLERLLLNYFQKST